MISNADLFKKAIRWSVIKVQKECGSLRSAIIPFNKDSQALVFEWLGEFYVLGSFVVDRQGCNDHISKATQELAHHTIPFLLVTVIYLYYQKICRKQSYDNHLSCTLHKVKVHLPFLVFQISHQPPGVLHRWSSWSLLIWSKGQHKSVATLGNNWASCNQTRKSEISFHLTKLKGRYSGPKLSVSLTPMLKSLTSFRYCVSILDGVYWMNEWNEWCIYIALIVYCCTPKAALTIMWGGGGGGLSINHHQCAASTWMMRRLPQDNGASALTTHQLQVERRESHRDNQVYAFKW